MSKPKKQIADIQIVLDYILDTEYEDFLENLNIGHIYYIAYSIKFGKKDAIEMINEIINERESNG